MKKTLKIIEKYKRNIISKPQWIPGVLGYHVCFSTDCSSWWKALSDSE